MKKTKKGFTLIELLLCVGIIGIVSAMGMTIAKRGTDKAYDLFFYTGFKNLQDVCVNAHLTGNDLSRIALARHLNDYLGQLQQNGKPKSEISATNYRFTANNGIKYWVNDGPAGTPNIPYIIEMQIPYKKTSAGTTKTVKFYYYMDNANFTIPYLVQVSEPGATDLMNNSALIPAYIDDGVVGRGSGNSYQAIVYDSYKNVLCRKTGTLFSQGQVILNCNGIAQDASSFNVKFSEPSKVKYRRN